MARKGQVVSKPFRIPPISNRRLQLLSEFIRPVVAMARGNWKMYRTHGKVVRQWFEPSPTGKLQPHQEGEPYFVEVEDLRRGDLATARPLEKATGLKEVHVTTVLYPADVAGPTPAHVLAQVPRELINDVTAYEVIAADPSVTTGNHKVAFVAFHA